MAKATDPSKPTEAPVELAERLLYEVGVSVLAGTAFGQVGTQHIRLSYANSRQNITTALERMRTVIAPSVAAAV